MRLIPKRKLASLRGEGGSEGIDQDITNIANNTDNSVTINNRLVVPVGTDLYDNDSKYEGVSWKTLSDNYSTCWGNRYLSQSFTPTKSHKILRVSLFLGRNQAVLGFPGWLNVYLYEADGNHKPTGAVMCQGGMSSNTLPPLITDESSPAKWFSITLTGNDQELVIGVEYSLVITCPTGNGGTFVLWGGRASYADGFGFSSTDAGSTWSASTLDFNFIEFGVTKTKGTIWIEGTSIHHIDDYGLEQIDLNEADVDSEPVEDEGSDPISSGWAFSHENAVVSVHGFDNEGNAPPQNHASNHTDGTDDIQDATAGQKGLATATQITKLDGIEAGANATPASYSRIFHANCFNYPDPISEWKATVYGASLGSSLSAKICYLPLNFLKAGDIITSYNLLGDAVEILALTLDCKLVQVNKADPLTTTDITNGAIAQVTADGNFDVAANCDDTTVTTDKQYLLQITGTTGVGDSLYVMGAEVTVTRLI